MTDFLALWRGGAGGTYPASLVVMSDQVYDIQRNSYYCTITDAVVKNRFVYNYLMSAAQAGTKIIIRIYPSPGNFEDSFVSGENIHRLITESGMIPYGAQDYCNGSDTLFRAVDDIASEMIAIHNRNIREGLAVAKEYFLPANEPNLEWYDPDHWRPGYSPSPLADNATAWQDMDNYFTAVYNIIHGPYADIHVLTPAMAQQAYAESIQFGTCLSSSIMYSTSPYGNSGYDSMVNTYSTKNDGYAWNNYWNQAKEYWDSNFCSGEPHPQSTHHIFQYL